MNRLQQFLCLTAIFVVWKRLLLLVALSTPGKGYDTSTTLLPSLSKLVRWDAIYYVQIARRGHLFEQEWAFGKGLSTLTSSVSNGSLESIILAGSSLAHICHYVTVLLVWQIAALINVQSEHDAERSTIPFIAASLHILSPAGIFLSAPYSESPFACLNMLGFWLYLSAQTDKSQTSVVMKRFAVIASGMAFGCATMIRSNGILSGLLFLMDAIKLSVEVLKRISQRSNVFPSILRLAALVFGGICIAAGLVFPQYLAYQEYCVSQQSTRPWCKRTLPLIYSFVQSHYW